MVSTESSSVKTSHLELNPNYITGFCEGEGTFTYLRNGNAINLRFSLKVPEPDRNLLFALQAYFRTGSVYRTASGWMFSATSIASLGNIVAHFDAYPLHGKKNHEYGIWREMFELKRIPRKSDTAQLDFLANKLSAQRPKARRYLKEAPQAHA